MKIDDLKKELKYQRDKIESNVLFLHEHNFLLEKASEEKVLEVIKKISWWIDSLEF